MTELMGLWLPILHSSVIVLLVSSLIRMTSVWHKNHYPNVLSQDQVVDALRPFAIAPGV